MPDPDSTLQDFKVQEGGFAGERNHPFNADQISGDFTAIVTRTTPTTLTLQAQMNFGSFYSGGAAVPSQLNGHPAGYGMYALFSATWQVVGGAPFHAAGGELHWYIDPDQNTSFSRNDAQPYAAVGNADDVEIASCNLLESGVASTDNFELCFADFTLAPAGSDYFVAPVPFPRRVRFSGGFFSLPDEGSVEVQGPMNVVFLRWAPAPAL